jgi:hypothetical protein
MQSYGDGCVLKPRHGSLVSSAVSGRCSDGDAPPAEGVFGRGNPLRGTGQQEPCDRVAASADNCRRLRQSRAVTRDPKSCVSIRATRRRGPQSSCRAGSNHHHGDDVPPKLARPGAAAAGVDAIPGPRLDAIVFHHTPPECHADAGPPSTSPLLPPLPPQR